jgi:hypothetical protein
LLAQGLQQRHLVGDAVDAIPARGILLHHGVAPEAAHDAIERHLLVGRESMHLGINEALHQFERLHDRTMALVVGTKLQCIQELGHHAAVVSPVGVSDHCTQGDAVGRPRGFPLLDQVAQRLFADHGKHHIAHHAVRLGERGVGQLEQQVLLAGDALEVVQ